ncbi:MAG: formylglycine-generating enzyme family protein [Proteobacteria bacterium]|nr:formylglycine-generating enzyme family protein [Pseudomonadota bacterium]
MQRVVLVIVGGVVGGCQHPTAPPGIAVAGSSIAPLSLAADERMIAIPAGTYVAGSTREERAAAYDDHQASTTGRSDVARANGWFEHEAERHVATLPTFWIDLMPVTQAQYAEFVTAGQAPAPTMDAATWQATGFSQGFATEVARFVWRDGRPPVGREDHPVVLVSWREASAYCTWRGGQRGVHRRLPTAAEFEKAARGADGLAYPWGNTFAADKLVSGMSEPHDTIAVGSHAAGASPFGVLDMAGNVLQWTSSASPDEPTKMLVKGSAWDDVAGVGRGASGHGRLPTVRHAIIGFRCAGDA